SAAGDPTPHGDAPAPALPPHAVPHQRPAPADPAADPEAGPTAGPATPADPAADPTPRTPGAVPASLTGHLTPEEARTVASWDRDLDALAGELLRARATTRDVPLPASLSASQLLRLAADPDGFAAELARPMPRPPQPAARRGTRFHAWVEPRFEELPLPMLGPDELPGGEVYADEPEITDERDLAALKEAFENTPYAHRTPYRVEAPFQITLAGRVVRGRIDAVYHDPATGTYEIVDWKTSRHRTGDPLQLAVYRLAWAELRGLPLDAVTAAFVYVRTGEVVRPDALPARADIERVLLGETADGTPTPAG
ncbi:PD-(D/E)XK nuclease family protein, partial [Streptomyces thermolilacinus]|uniref:PD-(D/E)XK nuclease family protein n=1 Tax=Streptomyces thermolilacinus TaxID=285540 RepID=UPI0033E29341